MRQKNTHQDERINHLLKEYKKEQEAFENHWLWKELKTTPKDFFAKVNEHVAKSGIDRDLWETKLKEAKKVIETRVREQKGEYNKVNFKNIKGLRV